MGPTFDENGVRTDIKVGMIAEDCFCHIGEVVACDPEEDYVHIKSLFDGVVRNCSLYHCGVYEVPPEEVELKKKLFAQGGMEALARYYNNLVEQEENS